MFAILRALGTFVTDLFKSQCRLEAENLLLRHQLGIALRRPPPRFWRYSGEIAVWNEGAIDTVGFQILDHLENKTSSSVWMPGPSQTIVSKADNVVITAGTTQLTATSFPYTFDEVPPLTGDIRNVADVTISNHSGHVGDFGPSPKATYTKEIPPPLCAVPEGCVYTQGYWGHKQTSSGPPATIVPSSFS
jgi:hypothetical protein